MPGSTTFCPGARFPGGRPPTKLVASGRGWWDARLRRAPFVAVGPVFPGTRSSSVLICPSRLCIGCPWPLRTPTPLTTMAAPRSSALPLFHRRQPRPQRFGGRARPGAHHPGPRHGRSAPQGAHAYLFSAGLGHRQDAPLSRILAMALNCEHPDDGEPDGTCPSCVAIPAGHIPRRSGAGLGHQPGIDEMPGTCSWAGWPSLGSPARWKVYTTTRSIR